MVDIDKLAYELILSQNLKEKYELLIKIWHLASDKGIFPSSIQGLYEARGKGKVSGFTVPAMNLRALTYDVACTVIRVAKKNKAGAFIFEIAKSEIGYTAQRPAEYAGLCLAAAIKEDFKGPIFIQGDHFQVNPASFSKDQFKEIEGIKSLIREAVSSGFFNIDIDSSTLVDLEKPQIIEQQRQNFKVCARLTSFVRSIQPEGVTVSVGGEIGEVGGKNSTPEELDAFMQGYLEEVNAGGQTKGISKISVQTGTAHGGVVLPDGSIAKVKLDFDTLDTLSKVARDKFGLAGAVQHGASTLPPEAFGKFPQTETAEIHLATEFQNIIYENKYFPQDLKERMYEWLKTNCQSEKKPDQTLEQFIYKTRKKALGPFKKELVDLPKKNRDGICQQLEEKFDFLFKKLNVVNTRDMVEEYVGTRPVEIEKLGFKGSYIGDLEGAD
jgi:fructose/tagatose bisphosphate aldolase